MPLHRHFGFVASGTYSFNVGPCNSDCFHLCIMPLNYASGQYLWNVIALKKLMKLEIEIINFQNTLIKKEAFVSCWDIRNSPCWFCRSKMLRLRLLQEEQDLLTVKISFLPHHQAGIGTTFPCVTTQMSSLSWEIWYLKSQRIISLSTHNGKTDLSLKLETGW